MTRSTGICHCLMISIHVINSPVEILDVFSAFFFEKDRKSRDGGGEGLLLIWFQSYGCFGSASVQKSADKET